VVKAMIRRFHLHSELLLVFTVFFSCGLAAQFQPLGNIAGRIQVEDSDTPSHQVLVELRLHGAAVNNVYASAEGYFSFGNLEPNAYHIVINDEAYYPVDAEAVVNPETPNTMVQIVVRVREDQKKADPAGTRASGSNPHLVDPADYNKRFPKKALKEYERGVDAEHKGKREEAIAHYEGALKIAPDYYPAHNNLGSLYLSKSDFQSA